MSKFNLNSIYVLCWSNNIRVVNLRENISILLTDGGEYYQSSFTAEDILNDVGPNGWEILQEWK